MRSARISLLSLFLIVALTLAAGPHLRAQTYDYPDHLAVTFTYNPVFTRTVGGGSVVLEGGGVQLSSQIGKGGASLVADFSGAHAASLNNSTIATSLITITGGGRYTFQNPYTSRSYYVQALAGDGIGFGGTFPSSGRTKTSAQGLAVLAGGGMDIFWSPLLSFRVIEADWLRTSLPNSSSNMQNDFRIGAGVKLRFFTRGSY